MEEKKQREVDSHIRYTEIDFYEGYLSEEILRRAKNLVKRYRTIERGISIKKSSLNKDSEKSK